MQRNSFVVFALASANLLLGIAGTEYPRYCLPTLCGPGQKHVACKNNGELGKLCPNNARLLNLSAHHALILTEHNLLRNTLAAGKLYKFARPERMATLQWSEELAMLAELNVKQCQLAYDVCHNTYQHRNSGQNLAMYNLSAAGELERKTDEVMIKESIDKWWDQWENVTQESLEHFPKDKNEIALIRNFAVMARDVTTLVGCAAMRWQREGVHHFLLACDYSNSYVIQKPIYRLKNVNCQTGHDRIYTSLCKEGEYTAEDLPYTAKQP